MAQFGVQLHVKPNRKSSGNGKQLEKSRDKRRHEIGNYFVATKLGSKNIIKHTRSRGGKILTKLKHAAFANMLTESGYKKVKIIGVLESKDNRNFARLNIITKGSVIETEAGKAVVINRPGREGSINARLIK